MLSLSCLEKCVSHAQGFYMCGCTISERLLVALVSSKQGRCLLMALVSSKQGHFLLMALVSSKRGLFLLMAHVLSKKGHCLLTSFMCVVCCEPFVLLSP